MTEQYTMRKGVYQHVTLEGTSYEVGRLQAEMLKGTNERFLNLFTSGTVDPSKYGYATFGQLQEEFEAVCEYVPISEVPEARELFTELSPLGMDALDNP